MSYKILSTLITFGIGLLVGGCGSSEGGYKEDLYRRSVIVVLCSSEGVVEGNVKYVRYKPILVQKGALTELMLGADGYLRYKTKIKHDADPYGNYVLYVQKHEEGPTNTAFGFNYEINVLVE